MSMGKKRILEEMIQPFALKVPEYSAHTGKCGRECCRECRVCVYHRPHRKDRPCLFRECPFLPGLTTSTYRNRKENHLRDRRRRSVT